MSEINFAELLKELLGLFEKKKYDEIHTLLKKAETEFPEKLDNISFWKACVYSTQGRPDEAITSLYEALEKGFWWNPNALTSDPDLNTLQDLEEFKSIVKKCEVMIENQKLTSKPQLSVYGNQHAEIGIFSLHWRGSTVAEFSQYWAGNDLFKHYLFGFPQSSQVFGYNAYSWDDQKLALEEIVQAYRDFMIKYNPKQVILSGASQGGRLSIELGLSDVLPDMKGFIAVIPAIQDVAAIEKLIKENGKTNMRGCIITGDQDPFYKKTLELKSLFEENGIACKWIVNEGLGHFFPDDFTRILPEAIDYILDSR